MIDSELKQQFAKLEAEIRSTREAVHDEGKSTAVYYVILMIGIMVLFIMLNVLAKKLGVDLW